MTPWQLETFKECLWMEMGIVYVHCIWTIAVGKWWWPSCTYHPEGLLCQLHGSGAVGDTPTASRSLWMDGPQLQRISELPHFHSCPTVGRDSTISVITVIANALFNHWRRQESWEKCQVANFTVTLIPKDASRSTQNSIANWSGNMYKQRGRLAETLPGTDDVGL